MNLSRSVIATILLAAFMQISSFFNANAQTDKQLFDDYFKNSIEFASAKSYTQSEFYRTGDSLMKKTGVSIKKHADLLLLIKSSRRHEIQAVELSVKDSANFEKNIGLLAQLPKLEFLRISDFDNYDKDRARKSPYNLPSTLLQLKNLKAIELYSTFHLDLNDAFVKFSAMPGLRGISFHGELGKLPSSLTTLQKITFVKLSDYRSLDNTDLSKVNWQMISILGIEADSAKADAGISRLAAIESLRELELIYPTKDYLLTLPNLQRLTALSVLYPQTKNNFKLFPILSRLNNLKNLHISITRDNRLNVSRLAELKQLESLELSGSKNLHDNPATIKQIASLSRLKHLEISYGSLTDVRELFSPAALPNLLSLSLMGNRITELADVEGYGFTRLQSLNLSKNQIRSIPAGFKSLAQLEELDLSRNMLTDVSVLKAQNLDNIKNIDLSHNQITSIPEAIISAPKMEVLTLSFNKITELPDLKFPNNTLKQLYINNNELTSLPESIGDYHSLTVINAGANKLTSLPSSFAKLSKLRGLVLEDNNISSLPAELGKAKELSVLRVESNPQIGNSAINLILSHPRTMFWADLRSTGIDSIPATDKWAGMHFVHLDLRKNKITGLPIEFASSRVDLLALRYNPLKADSSYMLNATLGQAGLKILFQGLGKPADHIKVIDYDYVVAMTERIVSMGQYLNEGAALVAYADKARKLNETAYNENIDWFLLGIRRFDQKDYRGSIQDFETFLKLPRAPTIGGNINEMVQYFKSEAHLALGEKEKAAETLLQYIPRSSPGSNYIQAALIYRELGKDSIANELMGTMLKRYDKDQAGVVGYGYPMPLYDYVEVLISWQTCGSFSIDKERKSKAI